MSEEQELPPVEQKANEILPQFLELREEDGQHLVVLKATFRDMTGKLSETGAVVFQGSLEDATQYHVAASMVLREVVRVSMDAALDVINDLSKQRQEAKAKVKPLILGPDGRPVVKGQVIKGPGWRAKFGRR